MKNPNDGKTNWKVDSIRSGPAAGEVSLEVDVHLQRMYRTETRFTFQYNQSEDPAGPIYIPGRWGTDADDKVADRDNRAAFETACAVANETSTRAELYVHSQEYLNSVSEDSVADLIGKVGEGRVREILKKEVSDLGTP